MGPIPRLHFYEQPGWARMRRITDGNRHCAKSVGPFVAIAHFRTRMAVRPFTLYLYFLFIATNVCRKSHAEMSYVGEDTRWRRQGAHILCMPTCPVSARSRR